MENNEIPPYDIPFDNEDNSGINSNPASSENMDNNPAGPLFNIDDNEENVEEFPQEQETEIEAITEDETKMEDTYGPEPVPEFESAPEPESESEPEEDSKSQNKKGGSLLVLLGLVFILALILSGSLAYIYADTLNIPLLSKKSQNNVKTMDLNNDLSKQLDSLPEEEVSSNGGILDEESEDTGIIITRDRGNSKNKQDNPLVQEDMESLGKPGSNEQFPPLPRANNQDMNNNQLARARYYSSGSVGRLDPFNPRSSSGADLFEIIVPPVDPTPDTETQALMSLRISGIMYTPEAPSAIINIKGQDQLVRKGDKFDGFSVEKITKDKVTVKAGVNVYTASVGEILNIEQVGINSIPNLGKKFAGPYTKGKGKIIEINMID